jgi:hypothetical protein
VVLKMLLYAIGASIATSIFICIVGRLSKGSEGWLDYIENLWPFKVMDWIFRIATAVSVTVIIVVTSVILFVAIFGG